MLPISNVAPAAWIELASEGPGQWTITDSVARYWSIFPESDTDVLLAGTTLYPELDAAAIVTVRPGHCRITHLPGWIFYEPADPFIRATEQACVTPRGGEAPPLDVPPAHPLARCPAQWQACSSTLTLPDEGVTRVNWQDSGFFGTTCYAGTLSWSKRYRYRFGLACTRGETRTRQRSYSYSIEVELAAEGDLGLADVGTVRTGITQTRTEGITDTFSIFCCRAWTDDGRPIQACRTRYFQPVYDHELFYRVVDCDTDEPSGNVRHAQAVWLDDLLDVLRCCDECCPVR